MKQANRKTYIDTLRILANFLVIFNHTAGYTLYQNTTGIVKTSAYTALSIITKINIPLFFMITGILLLDKEEETGLILKKRVFRFLLLIVFANTLMYLVRQPADMSILGWLAAIFNCSIEGSYWYLYTHLAFLLMLPYIRKLARDFSKRDFLYVSGVRFVIITLLPILGYVSFANTGVHFNLCSELRLSIMTISPFFYPIIGYYLDKKVDIHQVTFKKLLPLFALSAIGVLTTGLITYHEGLNYGYTEDFFQLFDYVLVITIFLTAKYLFVKKEILKSHPMIIKSLNIVAPLTLGIYILDPCLKLFLQLPMENIISPYLPTLFVSFSWCLVSMLAGGCITFVLKKLPLFKKIM